MSFIQMVQKSQCVEKIGNKHVIIITKCFTKFTNQDESN